MSFGKILPPHILKLMSNADRAPLGKAGLTIEEIDEKQRAKLEKELHRRVAGYLAIHNVHMTVRSRMDKKTTQRKGIPDFLFAIRGRAVAWELKLPGKELSDDQVRVSQGLIADGWSFSVIRSINEAVEALGKILNETACQSN